MASPASPPARRAEAGEHLYGWMVEDLVSIVTRGLAEVPPLPQSYTQRATAPATETAS